MSNEEIKKEIDRLMKIIKENQEVFGAVPRITVPGAPSTGGSIEIIGEITLPNWVIEELEERCGINELKKDKK